MMLQINYFQGHTFGDGGTQLNKMAKVSNYYLQIFGTDSVRIFNLDQATPQTIVNGIPFLDESRSFTEEHQIVDKMYVDQAVTSLGSRYYAWDSASGVSDYKLTYKEISTDTTMMYTKSGLVDDDYVMGWISPPGDTFLVMIAGNYDFNIYTGKTAGTKTLRIYWKMYERKADASEVLIGQSPVGNAITAKTRDRIFINLADDYIVTAGSRIVGKIYANVSGSGSAPTIALYYEGDEDSHWAIPVNTDYVSVNYVPYSGASKNITLGAYYISTAGIILTDTLTKIVKIGSHYAAIAGVDTMWWAKDTL